MPSGKRVTNVVLSRATMTILYKQKLETMPAVMALKKHLLNELTAS
jgi:hypothetical protein